MELVDHFTFTDHLRIAKTTYMHFDANFEWIWLKIDIYENIEKMKQTLFYHLFVCKVHFYVSLWFDWSDSS